METKADKKPILSGNKLIALILCVLAAASAALAVFAGSKGGGTKPTEARNGIVWVYMSLYGADGEMLAGGSGTGWAIGKPGQPVEYIVTNGHVVQYAYEYPKAEPNKYIGDINVYFSAAENDAVKPQVVFYSSPEEKDIAILKLPTPTDKRVPLKLRASDSVEPGETAYALGYPGISTERQDYVTFDQSDITITKGIISKRTTVSGTEYDAFQMDVSIAGGNSGGPLVDEQGYVLGINTLGAVKYIDDETSVDLGMNYAIVIDELTKILDSERIAYTMKSSSASVLSITLYAAAALLLAGAVIFFFQKTAAAPSASNKAAGPAKKPILRGLSGKYAGEIFDLSTTRLTLGRDPARCNIVFNSDAPGISSRHCSLYYDAQSERFMLTDEGSTYGTYTAVGKKLSASIPEILAVGDVFYLADGTNRFVVTRE